MTLDLTKPVETYDGRPARIICTDRKGDNPLLYLRLNSAGNEVIGSCDLDGWSRFGPRRPYLVNVVNKTSTFQNIYSDTIDKNGRIGGNIEWATQEEALERGVSAKHLIGHVRRDYEDGVLVDTVVVPVVKKEN